MLEIQRLRDKGEELAQTPKRQTAIYARVSSHEQKKKGDLARQVQVAQDWYQQEGGDTVPRVFTDVGSGLNTTRRGLKQLCQAIEAGNIHRVLVTYPDRLTRFGFHYLATYFKSHGVTIRCLQQAQAQSLQEELVQDLIAIVTSFSGRVHGLRSHKNRKRRYKAKSCPRNPKTASN
jgi:predicted site-specific integrase-resolvase